MQLNKEFTILKGWREMDYIEYLTKSAKDKKRIIWGMGSYGKAVCDMFIGTGFRIDYFCDVDKSKIGKAYGDIKCISIQDVLQSAGENYILIANQYTTEVCNELINAGYAREDINIVSSPYKVEFDNTINRIGISEINKKMETILEMVEDEKSKQVLSALMDKWMKNDIKDDEFAEITEGNQYFCDDIISFDSSTVYVDIGAYLGDSLVPFLKKTKLNGFKKAICFELNRHTCDELIDIVNNMTEDVKEKIQVVNKGISEKDETIYYVATEGSSHVSNEGKEVGYLTTLNNALNHECPTFIKMDIEGSELAALKSGNEVIKKYKPDLAICIYHKLQDAWEIPLYIKSLVPEYKIYVRHHSNTMIETVCYATIK